MSAALSDLVSLRLRSDSSYDLFMVGSLRDMVSGAATLVEEASEPNHRAFTRLFGPMDPALDQDDPLLLLERQSATDDMVETVRATLHSDVLSPDEAFTWVRILSLSAVALSTLYGTSNQGPLKALLDSHGLIQHVFIVALDPAMGSFDPSEGDPGPS